MAHGMPFAEALVVQDERILAAGRLADMSLLTGPDDVRIDLGGHMVIPGLTDSHTHFAAFSFGLTDVNLDGVASLEAALERVRQRAAEGLPEGAWLRGQGFNANTWDRRPTRWDLDRVAPDRPVILVSKDMHSAWVNSVALQQAGITAATADPAGGRIVRDEHGEPTGILQERAQGLVGEILPERTPDEWREALLKGIAHAHARGVVGVHNMDGIDSFRAFQRMHHKGGLAFRVYQQIPEGMLDWAIDVGLSTGYGNASLRVGGVKIFADGSLGSQTAHMLEPFTGGDCGVPVHTAAELHALISRAVLHDLSVAVHAIGDQANQTVLDVLAEVAPESQQRGLRHRIEHAQLLTATDLPRFAQLGVTASVQPSHAPSDRYIADRYWGERCSYAYAFKSLLASGAHLAFGSDVPVEPLDPLAGIYAAVWRKRLDEPESAPWYPEQRLTVAEALSGFTMGAAMASCEESIKGSLAPGKLADLVVLDRDISRGDEESLRAVRVVATVIGGRRVYGEL